MKKYRLPYLILTLVVFTYLVVRSISQFSVGYDKGMSMMGIIVWGGGLIYNSFELIKLIKNRTNKSNSIDKSTSE